MKLKKPLFDIFITATTLVTLLVSGTGVLLPQSVESVAHFSWTNIQTSSTRGSYYFLFFNSHHQCIYVLFPIIKYLDNETWPYFWLLNGIHKYMNIGVYLTSNLLWLLFSLLLHGITKELYASSTTYPLLRAKHISNSFIWIFLYKKVGSKQPRQISSIQNLLLLILCYYCHGHFCTIYITFYKKIVYQHYIGWIHQLS